MMTGTEALPREVGPLRSMTSQRNGAAFMVSELAADWPREMMAGALANRLPAVSSSPVCRSGTVPALYLNVGRGWERGSSKLEGKGIAVGRKWAPRPQGVWYKCSDSFVLSCRVEVVSPFFCVGYSSFSLTYSIVVEERTGEEAIKHVDTCYGAKPTHGEICIREWRTRKDTSKTGTVIVNSDFWFAGPPFAFLASFILPHAPFRCHRRISKKTAAPEHPCFADASLPHCRDAIRRACRGPQPVRTAGERYGVVRD